MSALAVLYHHQLTVTLRMHKIILHYFQEEAFVPRGRNMLHVAILCRCLNVYMYTIW